MSEPRARKWIVALVACAAVFPMAGLHAEDWPQWRGVARDAVWNESGVVDRFAEGGLLVKWRAPVRGGFAGPVVAGGRVFVLDYQETEGSRTMDGMERLVALDEETGTQLWEREWPATYRNLQWKFANGPRATPAVDGNRVYVFGAAGMLLCFDTGTGELVWQVDTTVDYDLTVPVYGISQSPLVEGDHLIILLGGEPDAKIVAFDKATGAEAWRALDAQLRGRLFLAHRHRRRRRPATDRLARHGHHVARSADRRRLLEPGLPGRRRDNDCHAGLERALPLVVSQFHNGAMMLALNPDRPAARLLWQGSARVEWPDQTDTLHALLSTPIVSGDYLYGVGSYGELRGIDATTGERLWQSDRMTVQKRFGTAYFVRNGDRYFVTNDEGFLIIAPVYAGGVPGDRSDPAAAAHDPHARRRHRPLGRPRGALGASRFRQPPRSGAQRRRGDPAVARGRRLLAVRVATPRRTETGERVIIETHR